MSTATDRFAPPGPSEAKTLRKALAFVDVFRQLDMMHMPANYIAAFLAVALDPGKGVTAYAEATGMLRPVTSRILLEIGAKSRNGESGLGLVDSVRGSTDLRAVNYFLTAKGKKLLARAMGTLEGTL